MPRSRSRNWIIVFLFFTLLLFSAFLLSKVLLGGAALQRGIQGILILSLGSALIPCIAGYFGKRIFCFCFSLSVIAGMIYVFYVIIADTAPGWGDLSSMIGYIFFLGIGFIVAVNAELLFFFIRRRKQIKKDQQ